MLTHGAEIDCNDILYKVRCVLVPYNINRAILKETPDFWGPLLCVILYSFVQIWGELDAVGWIITFWIFGSFFCFVLVRSLGGAMPLLSSPRSLPLFLFPHWQLIAHDGEGEISYSQTLGIIGYSLLPLVVGVLLLFFLDKGVIATVIKMVCTLWATVSAGSVPFPLSSLLSLFLTHMMRAAASCWRRKGRRTRRSCSSIPSSCSFSTLQTYDRES